MIAPQTEIGTPVLFIPLTKGEQAIVDYDRDDLLEHKWNVSHYGYAVRHKPGIQGGIIYMHREIISAVDDEQVDHINGDKLDNRKANLRICTQQQNLYNKAVRKDSVLGTKGIRKTPAGTYSVRVNNVHIGNFPTLKEATKIHNRVLFAVYKQFARLTEEK